MKGRSVLPCITITSVAGSLPLPGGLAAAGPHRVFTPALHCGGTPTCHPQVHTEGVVRDIPTCPVLLWLGDPWGHRGFGRIQFPPLCAELRPAALITLFSEMSHSCFLVKATCPACGQCSASPDPTGIPLSQALSSLCVWDELCQVSAACMLGIVHPLPR